MLGAVSEMLATLGFSDFVMRLNHRRVLTALLEIGRRCRAAARRRAGRAGQARQDRRGGRGEGTCRRAAFPRRRRKAAGVFTAAAALAEPALARLTARAGQADAAAVANLAEIVRLVGATPAAGRIRIDPSLARGLSYYTGAIMEIAVEGMGSLGGGGRYDNLIGMFLGRDVPACGFSLGLERIIVVMTERGMFPASVTGGGVDVVVTFMDDDSRGGCAAAGDGAARARSAAWTCSRRRAASSTSR